MNAIASSPHTRGSVACEELRRMIASGELQPGEWLRQRDLAKRLGMSSTPLIEALRRLEQEGIVEAFPQLGARVRLVSCDDLEQFLEMRLALERIIVRRLIERRAEIEDSLHRLLPLAREVDDELLLAGKEGRIPAAHTRENDCKFHRELGYLAQAPLLVGEIDRLRIMSLTTSLALYERLPASATHELIVAALLGGNLRKAEKVIAEHFSHKLYHMLPRLRKQFGSGPVILTSAAAEE